MKAKKANKKTLTHGTERRDRDGSDRARPTRDARRRLRRVRSPIRRQNFLTLDKKLSSCGPVHEQRATESFPENIRRLGPPRRDADALRARLAALRHLAGADGNFHGVLK